MNDQDYIRKAVELANGDYWRRLAEWLEYHQWNESSDDEPDEAQRDLDALAAQLVRQVDATNDPSHEVIVAEDGVEIYNQTQQITHKYISSPDRTMNIIKAIVDSKVLDRQEPK